MAPFEWLLNTESVKIELWRTAICQNSSCLEQALLMQWQPVAQKVLYIDVKFAFEHMIDHNNTCQEFIHLLSGLYIWNNCSIAVLFYYQVCFLSHVQNSDFENCMSFTFVLSCYIVFSQFQEIYRTLTSQADYNVTLPMILSEWHKLYNSSRFEVWLSRLSGELGVAYWLNWMPNMTYDISGTLLQRFA